MKRKLYYCILAGEAIACVALALLKTSMTGVFSAAMAFPLEQIGLGLRLLSLSGTVGNLAAIGLYLLVCLLPCGVLLARRKHTLHWEDSLLGLLSVTLFAVLYLMINPGLAGGLFGNGAVELPLAKAILGSMVYSVLCAYGVLRVLRLFFAGGMSQLQRYLGLLLGLLNVLFVYLVCGAGVSGLLDSIGALQAGNTGNAPLLGVTYWFLALRYVVDSLPYVLDIFVVFTGLTLLRELAADRYSDASVQAVGRLSKRCAVALTVLVLSNMAMNLLQLVFAKNLLVVNSQLQLPLFSIVFVLATLLLARLMAENKLLKDDSDSII